MTVTLDDLIALANDLADAAAPVTLQHFRAAAGVDNKAGDADFDPVTEADRGAERVMRALIEQVHPSHGIHGEEQGEKAADGPYTWFLDPVDGTRQFIAGIPLWGTLIGLEKDGAPLIGVLDQPYLGERFFGSPKGGHLAGRAGIRPLETSGCRDLSEAKLGTTTPQLFERGHEFDRYSAVEARARLVRYGGDCYFYGMVAAGHLDLVVEAGLKPFDIMALVPIVEAAGGVVSAWDGGPANRGGRVVAAATPELHAQALEVLAG